MASEEWIHALARLIGDPDYLDKVTVFPTTFAYDDYRACADLQRPYIPIITRAIYDELVGLLVASKSDFFIHEGKLFTIGNADSGYAIMPLTPERESYYLNAAEKKNNDHTTHRN